MSARQPLVLVPGLACDAALWRAQVTGLADVAATSIADTLQDDSIAAMAERLLASAPERFALAGFSMGGYVALAAARLAPGRITRLALVATSADAETADEARLREAALATARERGLERVIRGSLDRLVHPQADPAVAESVAAMALRLGADTYARQQHAIAAREDGHGVLAALRVPALVLAGAQDRMIAPAHSAAMARTLGQDAFCEIERCGHMAPMEQPRAVNAALREWLAA